MTTETIDQAVVELVMSQVAGASVAQIEAGAARMERMAAAGQTVTDSQGVTMTPDTAREIASRLRAIVAVGQPAPVAAPAATPAGYTRIRIAASGHEFAKAVKWAKEKRGRYDGTSRTWLIPSDCNFLNAAGAYGWSIVERN